MNADDCNGPSYIPADLINAELPSDLEAAGPPHPERREGGGRGRGRRDDRGLCGAVDEGSRTSGEPASSTGPVRLANGKLRCDVCGKVCLGPNVLMVHKRSHTGERPFRCDQCGSSFTQKGNLLRHTKLHSGEKPFRCPHCSYACRRRDALLGHLRTHAESTLTVDKPYKCMDCGRSYKLQSALTEHSERCHSYLSLDQRTAQGAESKSLAAAIESNKNLPFPEHPPNSITKRKRSKPQKFLGEKRVPLNMPEPEALDRSVDPESLGVGFGSRFGPAGWELMVGRYLLASGGGRGGEDSDSPKPPLPPSTLRPPELAPRSTPADRSPAPPHGPHACDRGRGASVLVGSVGWGADEGPSPVEGRRPPSSQSTDGGAEAAVPARESTNGHRPPNAASRHPGDAGWERVGGAGGRRSRPGSPPPSSRGEGLRVVDGAGLALRSFLCEHCLLIFLDPVMFAIHMGCHGYRRPLECNVCGHLSRDPYGFSSHMNRNEHLLL